MPLNFVPDPELHNQFIIKEAPEGVKLDIHEVISATSEQLHRSPVRHLFVDPSSQAVVLTVTREVGENTQQALQSAGFTFEME